MIRLAVVTAFGDRLGGSDNILWSYLRNVDRSRVEPEVIFLQRGAFADEVAGLGMGTHVLPSGRLRNPAHLGATIVRVARLLRGSQPDLVLNWLSTSHLYGGPGAALSRMSNRTLWWQLDMHMGARLSRGRALDQIAALIPSCAIGACSEAAAAHQSSIRPRRPMISVLPGVPEPARFEPDFLGEERDRLGLDPALPVVGTIGRLFPWKGHHRLLEAAAQLNEGGLRCQALVVGGGGHRGDQTYETELREQAGRLAFPVALTGQVRDAARYLELMDVFVNCSEPEPFGLVVVEAMASRTATVAVNSGGPREIIEPGVSGVLAPSGAASDLAATIRPLIEDEEARGALAAGGRRRYEDHFREERMAREMTTQLELLLR